MLKRLLLILIIILTAYVYKNKQSASEWIQTNSEARLVEADKETSKGLSSGTDSENTSGDEQDYAQTEVTTYIREIFGEDSNWGLSVAWCESRFNPNAESPSGTYLGLFQFSHSTFDRNCVGSIYKWKDQARCAKKLYDKGETGHWPNCP